jgi:K+-sensing histidine kinase KdpD/CheY-like chemotaxis protein
MQRTILHRYGVAILVTVAAAACQYWLQRFFGEPFPLVIFPVAVLAASWAGGLAAGLVATVACTLAFVYLPVRPAAGTETSQASELVLSLSLILVGLLLSLGISRLRRDAAWARRTQAETEARLALTEQLYQLSSELSCSRTPAEVMATCLPELARAIDADTGAAFLLSVDSTVCELSQKIGYPELRTASAVALSIVERSLLNDAIRRRELLVVASDAQREVNHRAASETIPELREGDIVLPLVTDRRVVGAIVLAGMKGRILQSDEREFLIAAGRQAARTIDRAQLYETAERGRAEAEALRVDADAALHELQKAQEALRLSEARCRTLAARSNRLYEFSAGLSEAVVLDAVAAVIVRQGKVVAGASAGSVALLTEDGRHFEVLYSEEYGAQPDQRRRLPVTAGLCPSAAVATKAPVFVGSFVEWQEKYPQSAAIAADGGYVSSAALPLLADSTAIGAVSFHFTVPVNFDEEYKALLASVAQHCAQAVDRARMYEAAEQARREAETANRLKEDFLSTISHELRTPLNAILGWAAMLRNGVVDARRSQRAIEAIFNNATRQGRLIEDLLDVSRIVAGRAAIDLQHVDLVENIRGAVEAMMPLAAGKGVALCFQPQSGMAVTADPRRLEQIFLNLLTNAVKFTPSGGRIDVDVRLCGQTAEVRVIDTGAGIEPAFLPHVFERFRQADSATTRTVGGLGLGLFISRQLVEAQGGRLEAESKGPGCGATFIVTLPAIEVAADGWTPHAPATTPSGQDEPMPSLHGLSVLIVDDEPDALEVMAAALQACGASVVSASSARDALQTLERDEVDLLLSDIAMPGEDGCDLIRTIRAMPSFQLAAIPAAAVTAHAGEDERERALAAGFQMHLSKPVQPAALARAVATLALTRTT